MEQLESEIRTYLTERGWGTLRPSDIAKSISIEAAELLELFQWSNDTLKETKQDAAKMEKIKSELADVFIYALDMSVLLDLNTEEIIMQKLEQVKKKYPADAMRKSAQDGSGSGTDAEYLRIKDAHRRNPSA